MPLNEGRHETSIHVVALIVAFPAPALAVQFYCEGKVDSVGLNNGGGLFWIRYGTIGVQGICSVADTRNGAQPDARRAWMALVLAARAQDKSVRLYYDSTIAVNPSSCSGFQPWASYTAYFVETVD